MTNFLFNKRGNNALLVFLLYSMLRLQKEECMNGDNGSNFRITEKTEYIPG